MNKTNLTDELVYKSLGWRNADIACATDILFEYDLTVEQLVRFTQQYLKITGESLESVDIVFLAYELVSDVIASELHVCSDEFDLVDVESGGFTHARITPNNNFMELCSSMDAVELLNYPRTKILYEQFA